jgi:hypothetical protein
MPVIPGRREAASPESMNTNGDNTSPTVFMDSGLAPLARPGMTAEVNE